MSGGPRSVKINELRRMRERLAGEESRIRRQHEKGRLTARERIDRLLDSDSFVELDPFVEHRSISFGMEERKGMGDGVVAGYGIVDGRPVLVYSQDFMFMGGSMGEMHAHKISRILHLAAENGLPVIGFYDSGGARIQEGVSSLMGIGDIFRGNVKCSGVVPQIAIIAGPTAGGAAYSPALMDFIFMVRGISYMFITGPGVVREVTGEEISFEELGGADVHSSISGIATLSLESEGECFEYVKRLLRYLPSNNLDDPPKSDPKPPRDIMFEEVIPDDLRQPYDIHFIINGIVDVNSFFELQPDFAANVVIGFARIEGMSVGMVASQPNVLAGTMTVDSSDKVARFVRFCDAFNIPIITLQDVPGYLPGVDQEHGGIIRHGAKVLYAYAEAITPKVTIILRKSYGGAFIALGSKHIGADTVYALPTAELAVLGPEAAVDIIFRRELKEDKARKEDLISQYREKFANPFQAAKLGYIDDVILPTEIRPRIIEALAFFSNKRVRPHPPKKHGNMPV